ncbi:MAG: ABC transporter ATP-binding protein, partial [Erysipelotrichaceae bacterium]|nr:ABC transporter ATP-binding protein [Erysipelotrichaceae bacterium]
YKAQEEADEQEKQREAEKARQKGYVEKGNKETNFRYHVALIDENEDYDDEVVTGEDDFVIGVRPEFVEINPESKLEAEIYSSMPTGMETTIRANVGNYILTGVMFGGVIYHLGDKVNLDFKGNSLILFSKKNGRFITLGSAEVK